MSEREKKIARHLWDQVDEITGLKDQLAQARRERDEAREALMELSKCVLNGWTSPAFVRGFHERAVEIARAALAAALDAGEKNGS